MAKVYFKAAVLLYLPNSNVRVFPLLHILTNIYYCMSVFIGITLGVKSYLTVVLICVYLMTNDFEHLFMGLLVICMSLLDKDHSRHLSIFSCISFLLMN